MDPNNEWSFSLPSVGLVGCFGREGPDSKVSTSGWGWSSLLAELVSEGGSEGKMCRKGDKGLGGIIRPGEDGGEVWGVLLAFCVCGWCGIGGVGAFPLCIPVEISWFDEMVGDRGGRCDDIVLFVSRASCEDEAAGVEDEDGRSVSAPLVCFAFEIVVEVEEVELDV
jgi:hypothetical protein